MDTFWYISDLYTITLYNSLGHPNLVPSPFTVSEFSDNSTLKYLLGLFCMPRSCYYTWKSLRYEHPYTLEV